MVGRCNATDPRFCQLIIEQEPGNAGQDANDTSPSWYRALQDQLAAKHGEDAMLVDYSGRQNGEADLRIATRGDDLLVRRVVVRRDEP